MRVSKFDPWQEVSRPEANAYRAYNAYPDPPLGTLGTIGTASRFPIDDFQECCAIIEFAGHVPRHVAESRTTNLFGCTSIAQAHEKIISQWKLVLQSVLVSGTPNTDACLVALEFCESVWARRLLELEWGELDLFGVHSDDASKGGLMQQFHDRKLVAASSANAVLVDRKGIRVRYNRFSVRNEKRTLIWEQQS
jgi:hypothetical protein